MISPPFKEEIEKSLYRKFNSQFLILNSKFLGGGCINHAHKLETNHGSFFLKWNDAKTYPKMFEAEAKGLSLLRSANTLYIPEIILEGEVFGKSFLLLEWIETGKKQKNFWSDFGKKLALLHQHTTKNFGLDHDNYIGSLPQRNQHHASWTEFFIRERLEPQLKLAVNSGKLANQLIITSANLFK